MLWTPLGRVPALDCSLVWARFPRVHVASPSGVAVPSWLTSLSFTVAVRPWPGLIVWPGLLTLSLCGLSPVS